MKNVLKRTLAIFLAVVMTIGIAPLTGFVGLEWPEFKLPAWLDFSKIFQVEAEAVTEGIYTYYVSCGVATITACDTSAGGSITIPSTLGGYPVAHIDEYVFHSSSITSVVIPDSVISIGDAAFNGCGSLKKVEIGSGLAIMDENSVFRNCFKLSSFTVNSNNKYYRSVNGVLFSKDKKRLIHFPAKAMYTSITIPATVEVICPFAFWGATYLTSVSFADSNVVTIGSDAFKNCTKIKTIVLSDSIKSIESGAFYNTAYFNNKENWENNVLYIGNHLISAHNNNIANSKVSGDYTIKPGIKTIAAGAFLECTELTSITIPDSVVSIGDRAFYYCQSLKTVTIPDSVTSVGYEAFCNCYGLESVTVGNGVTNIGDRAFYNCKKLESINISDRVKSIGIGAFSDTSYYNNADNWENDVLYIDNYLIKAKTSLSGEYTVKPGTKIIAGSGFHSCADLTSIVIPDSVVSIGNSAFYKCSELSSITIPDSVKNIGDEIFYYCSSLETLTIPQGVESIGNKAFEGCYGLKSIKILSGVTSIDDRAFMSCSLESIVIPESVTRIDNTAFVDCCDSFTTITVYYTGTQSEWESMAIGRENEDLLNANIHFDCSFISGFTIDSSCKPLSLQLGESKSISYTTVPEDAPNRKAFWKSSNPQVATVDSNGKVKGVSLGTAIITGTPVLNTSEDVTDTCTVTVTKKSRSISAPVISSSTGISCVLSESVPSAGDGTVEYGWSLKNDSSTVTNWQTGLSFNGLSSSKKYYFFAKATGSDVYEDVYSAATEIILSCELIKGSVSVNKGSATATSAVYGETLSATFSITGKYTICWYRGSEEIPGANSATYTLTAEDVGCEISAAAKGDESKGYTATISSSSVKVGKATAPKPAAPQIYEVTENSVTVVAENGMKYKRDNRYWITPEENSKTYSFLGLYPGDTCSICTYATESQTHLESEVSPVTKVIVALTYSVDDEYKDKQGVEYLLNSSAKTASVSSGLDVNVADVIIPKYVWYKGVQYKVTAVSQEAFMGCTEIETVRLSDTITSIGSKAFNNCRNLKDMYFDGAAPSSFGANVFDNTATGFAIYYYKHLSGWKENIVNGKYNGYTALPRNAIERLENLGGKDSWYVISVVDKSGNVVPNANVRLNKVVAVADENGYAFFPKPSKATADIYAFGEGFYPYADMNYILNHDMSLGFVVLETDPSHVIPVSCNDKDIATGVAQLNCALDMDAKIVISGYSEYEIEGYSIVQDGTVIATSEDGKFEISNTKFQPEKQVIGVMHTSYGVDIQQVLNINIIKFKFTEKPISIGSDTSLTIPKNIPVLGGAKISMNFEDLLGNVVLDNECLKIGYDMDVVDKDLTKLRGELWKIKKEKADKVAYGNFSCSTAGYYVAYINSTGIYKQEGQLSVTVAISFNYAQEFVIICVPVVVEIKISATGEISFEFKYDYEKAKWWMPEINLSLAAALKVSAGFGCRFASAGLYGSGKMTFDFRLVPDPYTKEIYLDSSIGLYAKAWIFKYEKPLFEKDHMVIFKGTAPEDRNKSLSETVVEEYSASNMIAEMYNTENYKLISRDYLDERSEWLCGVASKARSAATSESNRLLQTSVYDNIEPKIVTCGETTMMLFSDDNGLDDDYNNVNLVYSVYDKESNTWSAPQKVDNNGFVDGYVDACSDGKDIYITYVELNRKLTAADNDLADFAGISEIAVSKFNPETGKFETPTVITDNGTCDMTPSIDVIDSVPTVVWVNNADNDMFGMTENNSILISRYENGTWTAPEEIVSESPCITSVEAGSLASGEYVAFVKDLDCNLSTADDNVVCIADMNGNITQIDTETDANSNVNFVRFNGDDCLVWYNGGNLNYITDKDSSVMKMFEEPIAELSSNYQLVEKEDGFDILFTNKVDDGSDIYGLFYDDEWSLPVRVTKTESDRYVDSFAATYSDDKLLIPYLSTFAVTGENNFDTSSNLCFTTVDFGYDLCIEDVYIDYDKLILEKTGLMEITVTNNGLSKVESVKIDIPELSYSQSKSVTVKPGETVKFVVEFDLPETITDDEYQFTVSPTEKRDINSNDNQSVFKLGYTDFSVSAEQKIIGNIDHILVCVTNNGNVTGSGVLQAIKGDSDGEVVYDLLVDNLEPGETRYYMIRTDESFFDEGQLSGPVTINVDIDEEEYLSFDNEECVMVVHFEQEIIESEGIPSSSSISKIDVVFDKNIPENVSVEIDENGNTFEEISGLSTEFYTRKDNKVIISAEYLSTLEIGTHQFTFVFRVNEEQTQERILYVTVKDSYVVETFKVLGVVESIGSSDEDVVITLTKAGETQPTYRTVAKGDFANYAFDDVVQGDYIMSVCRIGYTIRQCNISVGEDDVEFDTVLHRIGDLNGDGKVNTVDVARANASAKGVNALTGYEFACADINGDGKVNTIDVSRMNAHAKGVTTLW